MIINYNNFVNLFTINEAYRNNVHQTHFEDLIMLGSDGIDEINDKIDGFLDAMRGNNRGYNYTTKIDGSPAVICWHSFPGYPDDSICLKSFIGGANNALSSVEDITTKYGDRPDMMEKLINCLKLAKNIPSGEAWQGDCLFTTNDKKIEDINGKEYITFHPNKIVYAFSEENPDYDHVKNAVFGIAFHTIYKDAGEGKKKQSFKIDPTILNAPEEFYIMSPALDYNPQAFDITDIEDKYEDLKLYENYLKSNDDYETLVNNDAFMSYWNTFENANIADKRKVTLDVKTFWNDLYDYIDEKRTSEWSKKNAALKTAKGRSKALDDWADSLSDLHSLLKSNKDLLTVMVNAFNLAAEIKMDMWAGFKQSKANYSTFYKSRTKGIIDADMEGVAMSDSDGNIVKIVDRSTFSANNRDSDILAGWEHPMDKTHENINSIFNKMLNESVLDTAITVASVSWWLPYIIWVIVTVVKSYFNKTLFTSYNKFGCWVIVPKSKRSDKRIERIKEFCQKRGLPVDVEEDNYTWKVWVYTDGLNTSVELQDVLNNITIGDLKNGKSAFDDKFKNFKLNDKGKISYIGDSKDSEIFDMILENK